MPVTVTIDAAAVAGLAANAELVAAFPFLRSFARRRGCCKSARPGPDPARAARVILALPPERKALFKRILGADAVVVPVVRAAKLVKESF